MKFKFDANQEYQLDAINAVVDIFEGQILKQGDFEVTLQKAFSLPFSQETYKGNEFGFGNNLVVDDDTFNSNVKAVQKRNNIMDQESVQTKGRNFVVEMETGTGKTYVYLRTAFELNKKYGFKKFIVVVPSVAIREGVLKSIEIMKEHFRKLYSNIPFSHFVYNSKHPTKLRSFASGNDMQIMIINIDSFNKQANNKKTKNVIHDYRDQMGGRKPIEFIQATNPIVIMDEPQNMESENAKEAIESLKPLCTLRYSATHRDKYNLVYQLDPVKAFRMKLVKKISVASVVADNDPSQAYVKVEDVSSKNGRFTTRLKFFKQNAVKPSTGTFKQNDDLFLKSGENGIYRNGFIITEISVRPGMEFVRFSNGIRISLGGEQGGSRDAVVKKQIRETIKAHFEKEIQVVHTGIKVLTLFFLDKVENYRVYEEGGHKLGRYALWFEEIYNELAKEYNPLFTKILPVEKVHQGYFSKDKKGKIKNTRGDTEADTSTYDLIMRRKEELLSLDNNIKFIFSHSALREGWDNPNVFQICTLNETNSAIKKRQEIGRGLRLPVNQNGERVFDEYINNLVVVANESYQEFVDKLQKEFESDCGVVFGRLPVSAFLGLRYTDGNKEKKVSPEQSEEIWNYLRTSNVLASNGLILDTFAETVDKHTFSVPDSFKIITRDIIETIEKHQIDRHIAKHRPVKGKVNNQVMLDPEFEKFWKAINVRTIYSVNYSTEELVEKASEAVWRMDKVEAPKLCTAFVDIGVEEKGITAKQVRTPEKTELLFCDKVPDILSYIQNRVELTRNTIYQILHKSKRLKDFSLNPQVFMDAVVKEIHHVLHRLIIEGIQYEKLNDISYEMSKFREEEHKLEFAQDRVVPTKKSVYNYITYDSRVEKTFAENLEHLKNIKYFIKLPSWFKVPTPVGSYNPDWAILKENGKIIYMIRETKSTKDKLKLRLPETDKISCGYKHFEAIGVDYDVALDIEDI